MSTKLQQEVWDQDRCSGCGACVAACSKGVLHWDAAEHPRLEERQKTLGLSRLKLRTCEVCEKFCELSCPRLDEPLPLEPLATVSAQSSGVVHCGTPKEVLRALLVAARSADLIDGAVMMYVDPWCIEPKVMVATTVEEMASGAPLQQLWAPVLSALNEAIFDRGLTRLAVVGPPCVAEGARRLRESSHPRLSPYRAIRLTISPFCAGVYMPELVTHLLEEGMGIARYRIASLTISSGDGTMNVALRDGTETKVPLTDVERFTRRGCGRCDDFLGESADIAVGQIGAVPDHSTLITRSAAGQRALQNARAFGLLRTDARVDAAALQAAKAQKDRRQRARAFDQLRILMLDALADPKKEADVRRQFVDLYGTAPPSVSEKEDFHVKCSGC
jgi:coenzyme F420 hydrogenase subunit beta